MNDLRICIACLSTDAKLYSIENAQNTEIYEKLTNNKLSIANRLPKSMCYICYSQLRKCNRFMNMSQKAGKILSQLLNDGYKITPKTLSALDERNMSSFVTTILEPTSYYNSQGCKCTIKEHTDDGTTIIKHEPDAIEKMDIEKLPLLKKEPIDNELLCASDVKLEPTVIQETVLLKEENNVVLEVEAVKDHNKQGNKKGTKVPKVKKEKSAVAKKSTKKPKKKNDVTEKNSICNQCGSAFINNFDLRRHMVVHTGEKHFACNICDKKFSQNSHLAQHKRVHTGEKPYVCDICPDKAFNHSYNYKTHMRKHTDERSHKCYICESAFHRKGDLQRHIRSHTGEKPYSCSICDFTSSQKGHLMMHLKTHSNARPYVCELCKQTFIQKVHLKYHMTEHVGGKPYPCTFIGCTKAFNNKCSFRNHLRVHTGERPYSCDLCNKTFKQKCHLATHTKMAHAFKETQHDLAAELQRVDAGLNRSEELITNLPLRCVLDEYKMEKDVTGEASPET